MENQLQENQPTQNQPAENFTPSSIEGPPKPNKKLVAIAITIFIFVLAAIGAGAYWWQASKLPSQRACTMEAKLCPDGSYVGRAGPNCEFAACSSGGEEACKNLCGDGTCEEVVCMAIGCPCAESAQSCPQDCAEEACANEDEMCGGIAGIQCCSGLNCELQGNYPDASGTCVNEQTKGWQTYRNNEYGFEVKYPTGWGVKDESKLFYAYPSIAIYKLGSQNDSLVTSIAIYPEGWATDLPGGQTAESSIVLKEDISEKTDFLLDNGDLWAIYLRFKSPPETWVDDNFIFASVEIKNEKVYAIKNGQKIYDYSWGADESSFIEGSINLDDRMIEEQILSTFKFIK